MLYKESSFVNLCILSAALSASEGRRKTQRLKLLPSLSLVNSQDRKNLRQRKAADRGFIDGPSVDRAVPHPNGKEAVCFTHMVSVTPGFHQTFTFLEQYLTTKPHVFEDL